MEEEINYDIMRYDLDNEGYIFQVYFGCSSGTCTGYTGAIPDGYDSLEEWYEDNYETINAWKIVDGNLVYDLNKCDALETKFEKEANDNRYVCHKEISNLTNLIKSDNGDNFEKHTTFQSNIIDEHGTNKFASTYIELIANETLSNKINIKFNNGNLLTNDATSKTESGISFEVNADRSINIKGTATNDIEYDIGGTANNTKPILAFKKEYDYYLSSNGHQIRMYNFDGTDREEIYSGNGGVINFTDSDKLVTQIVLFIPNGTEIDITLKPMLNLGDYEEEYITYEGNEAVVYLGENTFYKGDNIKIEDGMPILQNEVYISDELIIGDDFIIGGDLHYLDDIEMPITYLDFTYMYCMQDVNLEVTYPSTQRIVDLTGYETPNGGFGIDEEGNMYANDGTFSGGDIILYDENESDMNNPKLIIDGKRTTIQDYEDQSTWYDKNATAEYLSDGVYINTFDDYGEEHLTEYTDDGVMINHYEGVHPWEHAEYNHERIVIGYADLEEDGSYSPMVATIIEPDGITTPILTQTSKAEGKKNFEILEDALKIINDTDIYKYHLINEEDDKKKHIGLVIGEDYKYSSEITSINKDGEEIGVDTYSMIAVCFKAIQEQQKQIKELKSELKKLRESE